MVVEQMLAELACPTRPLRRDFARLGLKLSVERGQFEAPGAVAVFSMQARVTLRSFTLQRQCAVV